jgi:hypothetical protein
MKTINFSSTGGASGDMILGTLIGLGADIDELNSGLKNLIPNENFHIIRKEKMSHGIKGFQTEIKITKESHNHRHLKDIIEIIEGSELNSEVKKMSIGVFRDLAEAEASVHGTTAGKIHFHEVGAVDSIVDIVGSCLAMNMLGVDKARLAPLPVGQGCFECQHGIMPLPAPATVELIKRGKLEIIKTDEPYELLTPTAAALLSAWKTETPATHGKIIASSNSFGHRELNHRPNLLRALLMENSGQHPAGEDVCLKLECNIDDSTPEVIGTLFDSLFDAGALEVFTTPVTMKKNRPGVLLTVLCPENIEDSLTGIIFRETSTFGIRREKCVRKILERNIKTVETRFGKIRIKTGGYSNKPPFKAFPEAEDCLKAARLNNTSFRVVYSEASAQIINGGLLA